MRVRLDSTVTFSQRTTGAQTLYVAYHAGLGKYYQFGAEEHHIASLLDGNRTITDVLLALQEAGIQWDPRDVAEFISRMVASKLATTVESESTATGVAEPTPTKSSGDVASKVWNVHLPKLLAHIVSQRFPLMNGQRVAIALERRFGSLFDLTGMACWVMLVFSGLLIVYGNATTFAAELRRMFDPSLWLVLIAMWIVAKAIHEAGHAIAARHHGVNVGKVGVMLFFLAPLAYVDVTDAWKLRSRWQRVQIALGGVYLEIAVAAIAAWVWWMLPADAALAKHLAAQFFLIAGPATLLVNANPLLRLDGYYVLSDLTEIPNLRMHGRQQLTGLIQFLLLRIPRPTPLLQGWRRRFATTHALLSVVFQIVWMGGLIIAVSMWAKGVGLILAGSAFALWCVIPLTRTTLRLWLKEPGEGWLRLNDTRRRLLGLASLILVLTQYLCAARSPLDRRVPVIVRYRNEQIARATADAFVRNVYVTSGQRIKRGMLVAELEDAELGVRRNQKSDELVIAELKAIQHRRLGQHALAAAQTEHAASLKRQLAELDAQLTGLRVIARRDGIVIGSHIENLEGAFVAEGQELLRICDPQEKELLASVPEQDMQAYQEIVEKDVTTEVRLRGGTIVRTVPASLRPRARRRLPHPALAATAGGPLAVEPSPDDDTELRTVLPRLESVTKLDPVTSVEIRAGQIGTMMISDNRSLVSRMLDSLRR